MNGELGFCLAIFVNSLKRIFGWMSRARFFDETSLRRGTAAAGFLKREQDVAVKTNDVERM